MSCDPILVLGASGFLGRTLVETANKAEQDVVGLARGECDIADPAAVERSLARFRPRLIVNAAAFTNVDAAETDRALAKAVNAEGPAIVGAQAAAAAIPVIHISTDYVFDGSLRRPYVEDDPVTPLGYYGRTKADGETGLRETQPKHVIIRIAWLFGAGGGGFVKMAVEAALAGRPVRAIVDQTGSPTAVVDLAEAILAADKVIGSGFQSWGTYHFAGDEPARRLDVVTTIFNAVRASGRDVPEIVPLSLSDFPGAAPRPDYSVLNSGRFVETFDVPASDWKKHLTALVDQQAATKEQTFV